MSIPIKTKLSWPLSLSEAKRHLRVEDDWHEDDDYIQNLIYAATSKAEQYIGKDIAETSNVQTFYDVSGDSVQIQEGNFLSFTDASLGGASLTVGHTEIYYNYALVDFTSSFSVSNDTPFQIYYKTGFDEGECPAIIKQAILIKIGDLYDIDRQNYVMGSIRENKAFEALLDSFRYVQF